MTVRRCSPQGDELSSFEKRLCNELQKGLPITFRPYEIIAKSLASNEQEVIRQTRRLVKRGVIRRIGVVINWRAIGKASALVTASVGQDKLKTVIQAVNALEGVSHNYLREHHFNLWFTLRADSQKEIKTILKKLSKRFKVDFHSLPVERAFKLDVRFDAQSGGRRLIIEKTQDPRPKTQDVRQNISKIDERILERLQGGLKVVKRPFDCISKDKFEVYDGLLHISEMIDEGVISRLGAMVNHHKLGFTANAMFVCKVEARRVVKVGKALADLQIVSHCYERKVFRSFDKLRTDKAHGVGFVRWPYNVFGMMHGRSVEEIRRVAERFVKKQKIKLWEMLVTAKELKKGTVSNG